jgi:hypothetical protein
LKPFEGNVVLMARDSPPQFCPSPYCTPQLAIGLPKRSERIDLRLIQLSLSGDLRKQGLYPAFGGGSADEKVPSSIRRLRRAGLGGAWPGRKMPTAP